MIRILLVDDHPSVCEGTRAMIEQEPDMSVTLLTSAMDALDLVNNGEQFHVMLFDLNLPVISGLELTKRVHAMYPNITVLIYTGYDIAPNFNILIESGISGIVSKVASREQLITSIRCAIRGESVIPTALLRQLRRQDMRVSSAEGGRSFEEVSINQKEQTILQEVAEGKSNKDIAAMMYMSQRSVEHYLSRIFEKLGVRSRSEAIVEAKKHGLIHSLDFL